MNKSLNTIHVVIDQTGEPVRWPCLDKTEALDIAELLNGVVRSHGVDASYRAAIITEAHVAA
jgi:hypothetical protein